MNGCSMNDLIRTAIDLGMVDARLGLAARDADGLLGDVLHRHHATPMLDTMSIDEVNTLASTLHTAYLTAKDAR